MGLFSLAESPRGESSHGGCRGPEAPGQEFGPGGAGAGVLHTGAEHTSLLQTSQSSSFNFYFSN